MNVEGKWWKTTQLSSQLRCMFLHKNTPHLLCFCVSRYGRVNYVLARRLELLREVGRLQESLDVPGDVSYTCETAGHFYLYQVRQKSIVLVCRLEQGFPKPFHY